MNSHPQKKTDPTPAEIQARCLAIQATWSAAQRELRRHGMKAPDRLEARAWQPRVITPVQRIDFAERH
jgi:hypothetical protein